MKKLLLLCGMVLCSVGLSLPVMAQEMDIYQHEDGSVSAVDSDGNAMYIDADGETTVVDNEGNIVHEDIDGSVTVIDTDGNVAHQDSNGNMTILTDP